MNANACVITVGLLTMPLHAAESVVYKCTIAGEVTYQGKPCEQGLAQQTLSAEPLLSHQAPAVAQTIPATNANANAELQPRKSMTGDALVAGMTDTKILNLREWGRPNQISRNSGEHGWHEEWTYLSRAHGTTLLRFVNGRLSSVSKPVTPSAATATPQVDAAAIRTAAATEDPL